MATDKSLKLFMMFLFVVGIIFIIISVTQATKKCPEQKIVYRYIPRTFIEDQENPVPLDDIFYEMFNNPTPWVASVDIERRKNDIGENLNRYYLSQI